MPEKPIAAYIMLASAENCRRLLSLVTQLSMCLGIYLDTDSVFVSVIFIFDRINDLIFLKASPGIAVVTIVAFFV